MEILTTPRLVLRRLEMEDFDALFALYRDEDIRRYFPEGTLTEQETQEELAWFVHEYPDYPRLGLWATILKENGAFIGRCGLLPWTIDGRKELEVAYLIDKTYWGRGLATEAARGILRYGFETLGRKRLVCLIDEENLASQRVAEKAGMKFERKGEDEKGPFLLYALERA